jgi:hypothetical protein
MYLILEFSILFLVFNTNPWVLGGLTGYGFTRGLSITREVDKTQPTRVMGHRKPNP